MMEFELSSRTEKQLLEALENFPYLEKSKILMDPPCPPSQI